MPTIQNSLKLMGLAFALCAAVPVGSNAEIKKLEVETKVTGPNDVMLTCAKECREPLYTCIAACPASPNKVTVATCYSNCNNDTMLAYNRCYMKCWQDMLKSKKE